MIRSHSSISVKSIEIKSNQEKKNNSDSDRDMDAGKPDSNKIRINLEYKQGSGSIKSSEKKDGEMGISSEEAKNEVKQVSPAVKLICI